MSTPTHLDLSFVLPCLNEEAEIGATLRSIAQSVPPGYTWEVIVADHGSKDGSRDIAASLGAKVSCFPDVRLGDLRNRGAAQAIGRVLIFLDADVSLTASWTDRIQSVLPVLETGARVITGSRTRYLNGDHWTARGFGMERDPEGDVDYLGTAHLLISTELYDELGGFAPDLDSGEDEEFGRRARSRDIRVLADPLLLAIHRGAPASTTGFFLRHLWHGMGDAREIARFRVSQTALAGLGLLLSHLLFLTVLAIPVSRWWSLVPLSIIAFPIVGKVWKVRRAITLADLPAAIGAHYLYLMARGIGPILGWALGDQRRPWSRR